MCWSSPVAHVHRDQCFVWSRSHSFSHGGEGAHTEIHLYAHVSHFLTKTLFLVKACTALFVQHWFDRFAEVVDLTFTKKAQDGIFNSDVLGGPSVGNLKVAILGWRGGPDHREGGISTRVRFEVTCRMAPAEDATISAKWQYWSVDTRDQWSIGDSINIYILWVLY